MIHVFFFFVTVYICIHLLGPSVGPANVSFLNYNKTTFKISWLPLTREKSHGKVILYDVKQELLSTGKRRKRSISSRTLNTTTTFVVLYDLPFCSRYNVSVRAYTKAGPGPYTQPRVLETSSEYDHNVLLHILVNVMPVEFGAGKLTACRLFKEMKSCPIA